VYAGRLTAARKTRRNFLGPVTRESGAFDHANDVKRRGGERFIARLFLPLMKVRGVVWLSLRMRWKRRVIYPPSGTDE
jgi:hypothetical protein